MKYVRENIDNEFGQIFKQTQRMAIKLDVPPSLPRRVARQMHRNNVPADIPKEYFKRSLVIPLLDNFIYELEFRFNDLSERSSKTFISCTSSYFKNREPRFLRIE